MDDLKEFMEELKKDPIVQQLKENRVKYFKDKKSAIFRNLGLLAELLDYDVLHTDEFDTELGVDIQEYLVLDAGILTICINPMKLIDLLKKHRIRRKLRELLLRCVSLALLY